jgi:hypothetical protein
MERSTDFFRIIGAGNVFGRTAILDTDYHVYIGHSLFNR